MKRSTKIKIAGASLFVIGSLMVQQFIHPMLYAGIILMGISWMLMSAQLDFERSETDLERMKKAGKDIEETLEKIRNLKNSNQTQEDEEKYFNSKRSEIDKEK